MDMYQIGGNSLVSGTETLCMNCMVAEDMSVGDLCPSGAGAGLCPRSL
jgi:hypothetical protein